VVPSSELEPHHRRSGHQLLARGKLGAFIEQPKRAAPGERVLGAPIHQPQPLQTGFANIFVAVDEKDSSPLDHRAKPSAFGIPNYCRPKLSGFQYTRSFASTPKAA
jgi:hypothetical protein